MIRDSNLDDFSNCWTLAEAVRRTGDSDRPNDFWRKLISGQLIAFGRRDGQAAREWLPPALCRSLTRRELNTSSARDENQAFVDIVVYPVLNAPNVTDILNGLSLQR